MKFSAWIVATTCTLLSFTLPHFAEAQSKKPSAKSLTKSPPTKPMAVKGQGQLVGGIGVFGETYTLKNNFNFTLLGAHYSIEPDGDGAHFPTAEQKFLVLDLAMKNVSPNDNWFGADSQFTAVDSKGGLYPYFGMFLQKSAGRKTQATLRPGQGVGQPGLKDPLQIVVAIPSDARIVKIMVNQPRLNITEEVFRYYIAGATKEEAGEAGNPKNVVTPLPDSVRDPSDPSGATALLSGKGTIGSPTLDCVSGMLHFRVDSVKLSSEAHGGNPPDEGKQWCIVNVTAQYPLPAGKAEDYNDIAAWDFPGTGGGFSEVKDSDGDPYAPSGDPWKPTKDDTAAAHLIKVGEEYSYRLFYLVPKDVTVKTVTLSATNGRKWTFGL